MGLKEIKLRMHAIEKTASITQAMHNIALSKIRKSTELLSFSKAFVTKIEDILLNAHLSLDAKHRLTSENDGSNKLYILITSDRGLAGSYHNQLFKAFLEEIKDIPKTDYQLLVLGKKGYYFAQKRNMPMINQDIIYNRDDLSAMFFRNYSRLVKDAFVAKDIDEVILFYNHYVNTATQEVKKEKILPIIFEKKKIIDEKYIYDAEPEKVIDEVISVYIESYIFMALADAKISEHASRMIAMKNATDNANDIVERLHLMYHRARQQEITSEIIDVVNGSNT
jgi:F-type H+-transporting ATPase subunit gamma